MSCPDERPDQASAPEQGVALTEGERRLLADRCFGGASPSSLLTSAVEQIIRDRTPGIQAAGAAAALDEVAGFLSKYDTHMKDWLRRRARQVRDSATGGGA